SRNGVQGGGVVVDVGVADDGRCLVGASSGRHEGGRRGRQESDGSEEQGALAHVFSNLLRISVDPGAHRRNAAVVRSMPNLARRNPAVRSELRCPRSPGALSAEVITVAVGNLGYGSPTGTSRWRRRCPGPSRP